MQLPGLTKELLRKLKEKNADFAVYPMEVNMTAGILDVLGNLVFRLLLLCSLLSRSSSKNSPGWRSQFAIWSGEESILVLGCSEHEI